MASESFEEFDHCLGVSLGDRRHVVSRIALAGAGLAELVC